VDLDERKAFICRGLSSGRFLKGTKTEQDRWVHLAPDVIPILREQRKRCGGALVFPIDRYGLYPSLKKAQNEAEVRHFPIKALRSGHVTAAIAAGVAPTDVQKQVGHSNVTTTLRKYTGATDKDYTDEGGL
jgi:integrase